MPEVQTKSDRYSPLGGLRGVVRVLRSRGATLKGIADRVGVSRETVRQDLIKMLGEEGYQEVAAAMRPEPKRDQVMPVADAVAAIRSSGRQSDDRSMLATAAVLEELASNGVAIEATLMPSSAWRFHVGVRPLTIRIGFPNENHKEFSMGLFRFKVSGFSSPEVAVFAMFTGAGSLRCLASYAFLAEELGDIRSLNLRFNFFERESKWSYARNRWSALSGDGAKKQRGVASDRSRRR